MASSDVEFNSQFWREIIRAYDQITKDHSLEIKIERDQRRADIYFADDDSKAVVIEIAASEPEPSDLITPREIND